MTVTVNGEATDVAAGTTVADVVARLTTVANGVAVAVNDAVVPRGEWPATAIQPGDRVEVLSAVQGG